jgi:hypothetical protein
MEYDSYEALLSTTQALYDEQTKHHDQIMETQQFRPIPNLIEESTSATPVAMQLEERRRESAEYAVVDDTLFQVDEDLGPEERGYAYFIRVRLCTLGYRALPFIEWA